MTTVAAPLASDLATPLPPSAAARIRQITNYWNAARPVPDRLPGRQHVDPMDLSTLLPDLWLIDVVREPERIRFRYRLQGTRLVGMTGFSFRGLWSDEVNVGFVGSVTETSFLACIETGQPQ